MRPLTHSNAKQLLPIANRPILHRAVMQLVDAGVTEVAVIVGDTADLVTESLGNGSRLGARVKYIRQESPLGLAHCVKIAHEWLGDSSFVMYLGDNMFESSLRKLLSDFNHASEESHRVAQVAVKRVDNPSAFGVASVNDRGDLISVVEKPRHPRSDLALVGTYLFTPVIHDAIDSISPSPRGELEITDAIQQLLVNGYEVGVSEVDGWWYDTGSPATFLECNAAVLALEGRTPAIPPSGVSVIPPCVIDPTARLERCTIGPFVSVGPGAHLSGVTIDESVILPGAQISGNGRIHRSIIGERSSVTVSDGVQLSAVVGDDCSLEVNQ